MKRTMQSTHVVLSILLWGAAAGAVGINLRHTITADVMQKTKDAVVNVSAERIVNQRVWQEGM